MIFILKMRPVTEKDLSSSNPILPEDDDFDIYLRALCEDLTQLSGIIEVIQNNSSLTIETDEPLSEEELMKRIKPVFTEDLMKNLRFVSLIKSQLGH